MEATAVTPFISVDEFLPGTFKYDAGHVDGRTEERPVPEFNHADMVTAIILGV